MKNLMPYAKALFEIGQESGKDALYLRQLSDCADVWNANSDFVALLNHPKVKRSEKENILSTCLESCVDAVLYRFLRVLNQHDVIGYLPQIYRDYKQCYDTYHRIETVEVVSASQLDEKQMDDLKQVLSKRLNKTVNLDVKVDPSLIAGLRVQTADFVLDNTILTKINEMKEKIKKS